MCLLNVRSALQCFMLIYLVDCALGKREFTEEERELAKNSGVDLETLSDDTVFIAPPKLSDEERGSKFMPEAYKCNGCKGVAYQLKKHFAAEEKKIKKGDKLSEADVIEVVETVCNSNFANYGLKNIKDVKVLSGEGLGTEMMSGMVQTGGIWKERMQKICHDLVGMYEEEMIYKWYFNAGYSFQDFLCRNYCDEGMKMLQPQDRDEL